MTYKLVAMQNSGNTDGSVGSDTASRKSIIFHFVQGSIPTNASVSFSSFYCIIFSYISDNILNICAKLKTV